MCEDSEGVLHNTTSLGQRIVRYPFFVNHVAVRVELHHPSPEREYVVSFSSPFLNGPWLNILASDEEPCVPTSTEINLELASTKAGIMIHLLIVVEGTRPTWVSYGNMFYVQGSAGVVENLSLTILRCRFSPLIWVS